MHPRQGPDQQTQPVIRLARLHGSLPLLAHRKPSHSRVAIGTAELLGRGVVEFAQEHPCRRQSPFTLERLRDSQIDQLDQGLSFDPRRQHEVVGRNVSMDKILPVQVVDGLEALLRDLEIELGRTHRFEQLGEIVTPDELHDQRRCPSSVEVKIVDLRDIRMRHPARESCLLKKPLLEMSIRAEIGTENLDDSDLVEGPMSDLVDSPHPTFTELLEGLSNLSPQNRRPPFWVYPPGELSSSPIQTARQLEAITLVSEMTASRSDTLPLLVGLDFDEGG